MIFFKAWPANFQIHWLYGKCISRSSPLLVIGNELLVSWFLPHYLVVLYQEGWKEMFYLMTYLTHLKNLRLYEVGHMVKDQSSSERNRETERGGGGESAEATTWVTLFN